MSDNLFKNEEETKTTFSKVIRKSRKQSPVNILESEDIEESKISVEQLEKINKDMFSLNQKVTNSILKL